MIETPIFVTSLFYNILDKIDVKQLSETVYSLEKKQQSHNRSGVSSFQSDFFINTYDNDITKHLFEEYIIPNANNIINYFWGYVRTYKNIEYWYNVNHPNSYNHLHNHVGSVLSGVFYIKVPENSGNINFVRTESEVNDISKFIDVNKTNPYTNCRYWSKAVEGKLIMFPSYLSHYVEQNTSTDDRISLSFNLMG
jgi:hypothetical protein